MGQLGLGSPRWHGWAELMLKWALLGVLSSVFRILMADFPVICFVPRALYLESISELFVLDSDLPLL